VTPVELSLWLAVDIEERVNALDTLLTSGDLKLIAECHDVVTHGTDTGEVHLVRSHPGPVTLYEAAGRPILPAASA
jgi:hypothetical protein